MSERKQHLGEIFFVGFLLVAMLVLAIWVVIRDLSAPPFQLSRGAVSLIIGFGVLFVLQIQRIRRSFK
jgi:hypothetical protein